MKMEELTPHIEELKRVIGADVDEEQLIDELNTYLNVYHVSIDAAKKGIMRKYGKDTPLFVSAASIAKKIGEMTGDEKNVDLTARVIFVEEKQISVRNVPKTIFSGILGDETATAPFTVWDVGKFELLKGETYNFRNAYTKKWNERLQINFGERSLAEVSERKILPPERSISYAGDVKISELHEGMGDVTVTGKIISAEPKTITSRGETKTVLTGYIADDTGKVQYTAWNDVKLQVDETICAKNAYIKAWKGVPQLNFGDQCQISRVDSVFAEVRSGANKRDISEIYRTGGGLDVMVIGTIVDVRAGSGIIRRCPVCNRSLLADECVTHGKVEAALDLRMKIVIDDGTGALTSIVSRDYTEKLTGLTFEKAILLSKETGDQDSVLRAIDERVLLMNVAATGNVLTDDFGPTMIVREIKEVAVDVTGEAEELMKKVEGSL